MVADDCTPQQDYSVFGLRVRSSVPLPELAPARGTGTGTADVVITLGDVPKVHDAQPGLTSIEGALLLIIPNVGRYRIEAGDRIIVQPDPGVPERNLRLFLLGSAFGALLHQRGLLPLHANAVQVGGSAVAFMGPSGSGKSTLAAWFHDRGYPILADDVCAVGFDSSGMAVALPGLQRLRLWRDALDFTGRPAEGFDRSYVDEGEQSDKFDVPIGADNFNGEPVPLAAVCLLQRAGSMSLTQLSGLAAAESVFANTYRGSFVALANAQQAHWESAIRLVKATPVFLLEREWDLGRIDAQTEALLERLQSLACDS